MAGIVKGVHSLRQPVSDIWLPKITFEYSRFRRPKTPHFAGKYSRVKIAETGQTGTRARQSINSAKRILDGKALPRQLYKPSLILDARHVHCLRRSNSAFLLILGRACSDRWQFSDFNIYSPRVVFNEYGSTTDGAVRADHRALIAGRDPHLSCSFFDACNPVPRQAQCRLCTDQNVSSQKCFISQRWACLPPLII